MIRGTFFVHSLRAITWIGGGLIASAAAAQGASYESVSSLPWAPSLAAAIAIGLGAFGAATAQGRAASAALEGIARNPNSRSEVFVPLVLSLVFMELQALLCFVVAFLVLK